MPPTIIAFMTSRRITCTLLIAVVVVLATLPGCGEPSLSSSEQIVLRDIFRSGLEMQSDPFVRAETLRAMTLTGDPELADHVEPLLSDSSPMVQVAAFRKIVSTDHRSARQRAMYLFNRSDEAVQYQILDASLTYGSDTLQRTMLERALRVDSSRLRLRALQDGLLRDIEQAREDGDEEQLRHELLPELSRYVDDEDPEIAAIALATLTEAGQYDRADAFIERLADDSNSTEDRIDAARTLVFARVERAREIYTEILDDVGAYDPDTLGIPDRRIDERLLRLAVLGETILGNPEFVDPAMTYLDGAESSETVEVLEVLAANPSPDASIALRTHMRDANPTVRRRAIALYGERDDVRPDALIGALRHDDYESQRMLVGFLSDQFADSWVDYLDGRLDDGDPDTVERTLRMMQTVLRNDHEFRTIAPLQNRLENLATGESGGFDIPTEQEDDALSEQLESIANIAAYLLFRVSDEGAFQEVIRQNPDPQTRYAYLEHLVNHDPHEHIGILRQYLYDDIYALRLMAATGLWIAFADTATWPVEEPEDESP